MTLEPLKLPAQPSGSDERYSKLPTICIAIAYCMPALVAIPFFNADGWYGTGDSGRLQRIMQVVAFVIGLVSSYLALLTGTWGQRLCVLPAALGYTGIVIAILVG